MQKPVCVTGPELYIAATCPYVPSKSNLRAGGYGERLSWICIGVVWLYGALGDKYMVYWGAEPWIRAMGGRRALPVVMV